MRVLMIGRSPSIALDELRKYWGEVDVVTRPSHITLKRYDLIIAQEPTFRIGIPAMLQAKISNSYFVCEIHSDYLHPRFFPLKDLLSAKIILKLADAVRVVNKSIKIRLKYWKVKKILVIPSVYIRPDIFRPFKNVEDRSKVLLSASRLVTQKGLDLLINAVPYLITDFPDLEVRIIGDGPEKNKLELLVRQLRLSDVVKFLG